MSLREVLDVLYPHAAVCLCCGDPRRADEKYCLCPDCREALTKLRLREGICLRCMSVLDAHGNCPFCAGGGMEGLREGYVAYRHTGVARQLVAELKYRYCNEAAAALAAGMASCAPAYQYDALVPVPLHKRRQRMRIFCAARRRPDWDYLCSTRSSACAIPGCRRSFPARGGLKMCRARSLCAWMCAGCGFCWWTMCVPPALPRASARVCC